VRLVLSAAVVELDDHVQGVQLTRLRRGVSLMSDGDFPLYCARCAAEAIRLHQASAHSAVAPQFRVVNTGEVSPVGPPGVWRVPRARIIFLGNSLCLSHLVDQQTYVEDQENHRRTAGT
jgi:hypothetical protein